MTDSEKKERNFTSTLEALKAMSEIYAYFESIHINPETGTSILEVSQETQKMFQEAQQGITQIPDFSSLQQNVQRTIIQELGMYASEDFIIEKRFPLLYFKGSREGSPNLLQTLTMWVEQTLSGQTEESLEQFRADLEENIHLNQP